MKGIWVVVRWGAILLRVLELPRATALSGLGPRLLLLQAALVGGKGGGGFRTTEVGGGKTGGGDALKAAKGLGRSSPRGHALSTSPQWARVVPGSQSQAA